MLVPVPPSLAGRLESFDPTQVAPTKDAATIAVVRDGPNGLEAFLMRRHSKMEFAPGMYVFPGGGVQDDDASEIPWVGPSPGQWAERFGCSPQVAKRLVVAAIRETFEETGVLLAGPDERTVIADTTALAADREALEAKQFSFADFLMREKLVLRSDLLSAWAHWITPSFEPRRYDTRFFVAAIPEGQRIASVSTEADRSMWAPLSQALVEVAAGRAAMLPPTSVTCRELAALTTSEVATAAADRRIYPIEPKPVRHNDQWWLDVNREEDL
ncbi:MAG TPA: NUDIX domain-containing protein [Aeromicrobium sp.]|nr:NUDIX domain-containing protein [Aeromicrobium sp.]